MGIIDRHIDNIQALCKKHNVARLFVFGSILTDNFRNSSDIDFLVDFSNENVERIIGTRNKIIHGYDQISDDLIWSIVINHIPKLKEEVTRLLDE